MPLNNLTIYNAKWGVMWISPKTGKWVEKHFEDDLPKAIEFQNRLVVAGRKATVRCLNVGFPPPKRITEYEQVEIVVRNGKKRRNITIVNLMEQYNSEGVWWCPYCIKCRRFQQKIIGVRVAMICPACGVSSRDGHVKRYNPESAILEMRRKIRKPRERRGRSR